MIPVLEKFILVILLWFFTMAVFCSMILMLILEFLQYIFHKVICVILWPWFILLQFLLFLDQRGRQQGEQHEGEQHQQQEVGQQQQQQGELLPQQRQNLGNPRHRQLLYPQGHQMQPQGHQMQHQNHSSEEEDENQQHGNMSF